MKVVVVGAGVLGAATAASLAEGGADVTVVDAQGPGSGTSSRGVGLVCEGMWHPTSLALVRRSIELLLEWGGEGEAATEPWRFHPTGSSTLVPEALAEPARRLAEAQRKAGAAVETLAPGDAAGLPLHDEMRLDDVALVLHYPRDGWALPRLYAESILQQQEERLRLVRARARLVRGPDGVGVEADGERVAADVVVVAAGVWTRALLREMGLDAPLLAYRTQAMRYHAEGADLLPIVHDAVQGLYLRPHWHDQLMAGDGTTTTPEDPLSWRMEADAAFVESTVQRLRHRFPELPPPARFDAWAGIDAATPDRLLLAGRHPDDARVWVLAGGNGHGFMRAPATGESLAALVLGKRPRVDLSAYDPGRFRAHGDFAIREGYTLESPSF